MEEGVVRRVEYSGVFGVHEHRIEVREVRKGVRILGESRRALEQSSNVGLGDQGQRPQPEGAVGPGLWVRQ